MALRIYEAMRCARHDTKIAVLVASLGFVGIYQKGQRGDSKRANLDVFATPF